MFFSLVHFLKPCHIWLNYLFVWIRGFFHGYSFITVCMILNHALRYHPIIIIWSCLFSGTYWVLLLHYSGIAVSMVMKYADNIVKVKVPRPGILTWINSMFQASGYLHLHIEHYICANDVQTFNLKNSICGQLALPY